MKKLFPYPFNQLASGPIENLGVRRRKNFLSLRRFLPGNICVYLCLSVVALFLSSCAEISKDVGLADEVPDVEQREGPVGTPEQPFPLDPFQKYDLVMAANECRYFQMKLPEKWYWKVAITVVNRQTDHGRLRARLLPLKPAWSPLANLNTEKTFDLGRESIQGAIGVTNDGLSRVALLQLCQEGPPLRVTLESQIGTGMGLPPPVPASPDNDEE